MVVINSLDIQYANIYLSKLLQFYIQAFFILPNWSNTTGTADVAAVTIHVSWGVILHSLKSPQIQSSMCFLCLVWRFYAPG